MKRTLWDGFEMVGIAADTRYANFREKTPAIFYVPYVQNVNGPGRMVVELGAAARRAACSSKCALRWNRWMKICR